MSHINQKEVLHIAKLCSLELTPEELSVLTVALSDTIEYIQILKSLDTLETAETFQVTGLFNVFQSTDPPETALTQDQALSNAKKEQSKKFVAPAVFER